MATWLVTGAAGFLGYHTSRRLLETGHDVVGIDSFDPYYSVDLKRARWDRLVEAGLRGLELDIRDMDQLRKLWLQTTPSHVIHFAAQAGVRHALKAPQAYVSTNVTGFANVLECCRAAPPQHLVYASSSSVYGAMDQLPYDAAAPADHPVSLYAATKRSNELMAHTYSHLFGIPTTGLRFFTAYGPWGRPDMAYMKFTRAILDGEELQVYGDGTAMRDFTYVDDTVEAVVRIAEIRAAGDLRWSDDPRMDRSTAPWRIYNVGHGGQHSVRELISLLEGLLDRKARVRFGDPVPGDVAATEAETTPLRNLIGFEAAVDLQEGLRRFADWYVVQRQRLGI